MKSVIVWIVIAAIVGGVGAGLYYYVQRAETPPPPPPAASAPPVAQGAPEPRVEPPLGHPLPQVPPPPGETKPVPPLNESDPTLQASLVDLFGAKNFADLFNDEGIVRRIVVTVDNLPRQKMAQRQLPLRPAPGAPIIAGTGDNVSLSPDNAARYAAYVQLASAVDTKKLVSVYVYFYPLFQQAYMELGYPSGYFNDRLIAAIDNLLATPDIAAPIALVQPKVLYEYADPQLESLSAGQKALLRAGPDNEARLKTKLRELRRELVVEAPKR
jgi:Protein of unknown function (DUF3014)